MQIFSISLYTDSNFYFINFSSFWCSQYNGSGLTKSNFSFNIRIIFYSQFSILYFYIYTTWFLFVLRWNFNLNLKWKIFIYDLVLFQIILLEISLMYLSILCLLVNTANKFIHCWKRNNVWSTQWSNVFD